MSEPTIEQLAQKISAIKQQIEALQNEISEIDYVEWGAYDVGTIVRLKDSGKVGWVKEIDFRNRRDPGFTYKVGSFKKNGMPSEVGVVAYFADHENLEVIEDGHSYFDCRESR